MKLKNVFNESFSFVFNEEIEPCFFNNVDNSLYLFDKATDTLVFFKKLLILRSYQSHSLSMVRTIDNYSIFQDLEAYGDANSVINEVYIFDTITKNLFLKYKYNIILSEWVEDRFFFSNCHLNDTNERKFFFFNPFTKEEKWHIIFKKQDDIRSRKVDSAEIFVFFSDVTLQLYGYSKQTGSELWRVDLSYLKRGLQDDYCRIVQVKYNEKVKQIIVGFQNGLLLGVDVATGIVKWHITKSHIGDALIDPTTGNIFYRGSYVAPNVHNKDCIDGVVLSILNPEGLSLKTVLLTDEQLKIKAYCATQNRPFEGISARERLLGVYGDYLYFTVDIYPLLYKVNKHTLVIEDVYEHDKPFYPRFVFIQNKLIISDLHSIYEDKNRLLVFELE